MLNMNAKSLVEQRDAWAAADVKLPQFDVAAMVAAHTSPAQRENLRFVALDTDANDLRALRAGGYPGKVIQTSANMTVKEYLHIDKHAAETWFPATQGYDA